MATLSPPTPADFAANRGPNIIAGNLVGAILATIAVSLRFFARYVQGKIYGIDDVLIIFALVMGWGMAIATIIAVHYGLGRHLNTLWPGQEVELEKLSKAYYSTEIIWTLAILAVKMSILIFYNRLFGKFRYFRYTAAALGVFTICWAITTIFVIIFQCTPVSYDWNKFTERGHCIHANTYFIIGSAMDVAVDLALFFLPMHAVWQLHLPMVKRLLLALTFAIGSLSCIFGIVRLAMVCKSFRSADFTWALSGVALWSTLEPCLGITAICLCTTRPLYGYATERYKYLSSYFSNSSHRDSQGSSVRKNKGSFDSQEITPTSTLSSAYTPNGMGGNSGRGSSEEEYEKPEVRSASGV